MESNFFILSNIIYYLYALVLLPKFTYRAEPSLRQNCNLELEVGNKIRQMVPRLVFGCFGLNWTKETGKGKLLKTETEGR